MAAEPRQVVTIARQGAALQLGEAAAVCLGCGEPATRLSRVWFEPELGGPEGLVPLPGAHLVAGVRALRERELLDVPLGPICLALRRQAALRAWGWGGLGLGAMWGVTLVPWLLGLKREPWLEWHGVLVAVLAALAPLQLALAAWKRKDRGGDAFTLRAATPQAVELELPGAVAALLRARLPRG